jgi:ferritin-like metal-binding protein YciE
VQAVLDWALFWPDSKVWTIPRGDGTMNLNSMNDLLFDELRDLYSAENQLLVALPLMANAANSSTLKKAFQQHLEETRGHVQRLTEIFTELGQSLSGESCKALEGLIAEGNQVIQTAGDPDVKDAALIGAAQRVEHYEMAGYGLVRTFAKELGYEMTAKVLQQTLDEEGAADKKLTSIAEGGFIRKGINQRAANNN